ncbi:tripartite tricarboxylate transporter substrate binding protein [Bradyrhizobium sp. LHD-71]|uniref:Bug family tripartite tricarboxylate transporter substrate binding protein n=1 Tax=Bradyrhizobium sp. LHD-71 TaxID=3072141 RepID=UPI00280CEC34|nr:tripartite tricarboxylate transporter substrate binding protein [Bradyrhizobium sp. LHD-71]MDQ8727909.1 tripartite tricarboxylate transporter substrate binding protein [Bradyrhizobium sp. LHD-71]
MLRHIVFVLALLVSPLANAQDYPTRPIKLIVPFPAGGPADIFARSVGHKMQELLGQPVILDNRSGAGGVTGIDAVSKAEPDGYTIGIGSAGPLAISASLLKVVPFDSTNDLAPIGLVVRVPEIAVVASNVPAKTSAEFVALAKASPGKINFASTGTGGTTHLAAELYKIKAGINIVHIPYRGAAPAVTDILGNQVQLMFADIPVLLEHVQAGTLKAIGTASKTRAPVLPDLPTFEEQGTPGVLADNWYGLVAPPKTPPAIIAKLNKAVNDAVKSADVKSKLEPLGAVMGGGTPEEFGKHLVDERAKWAEIIKAAGVPQQ